MKKKLFYSFLIALLVPMTAGAREMYAVYDDRDKTFTFYYDDARGDHYGLYYDFSFKYGLWSWYHLAEWHHVVKKIVFDSSFADARPTSTHGFFSGSSFENVTEIAGIENLNTSNVSDMHGMFEGCESLTAIDLSHFNTCNVTDMSYMFANCSSLTTLDVSHFDTSNVTNMNNMFSNCSSLTVLDLSHFDTQNVTEMISMFWGCSALTALDVSHFDTGNVTNISEMFWYCSMLTTLDVNNFDISNVENIEDIFSDCKSLTTIYCNNDWKKNNYFGSSIFDGCTSLVGGAGTVFDKTKRSAAMAHPDSEDNPGYFTRKSGTEEWPQGDLMHDGKVDVADVVALVALMMNPGLGNLDEGDLNHDGVVNTADVVSLINLITK